MAGNETASSQLCKPGCDYDGSGEGRLRAVHGQALDVSDYCNDRVDAQCCTQERMSTYLMSIHYNKRGSGLKYWIFAL